METPIPIFVWSTDFENGLAGFNGAGVDHWEDGPDSYYEIVDDPTGSGRGKVYKGVVTGPPPNVEATNHGHRHRPYPDVYFPFVEGPFATEFDLWVSAPRPMLRISPPNDTDAWFSPVSLFDVAEPDWHFAVNTHLGVDPRVNDGKPRLVSLVNADQGWMGSPSAIPFPLETWVRIRAEVGIDRRYSLYQDGTLVSEHKLSTGTKLGTSGGHWGLYAGRDVLNLIVLNDNIIVVVYPNSSP